MIQFMTRLKVADNTGAKEVGVIKILGNSRQRYATVGDIVKVSVKNATPTGQIKKGQMSLAVIIRVHKNVKRIAVKRLMRKLPIHWTHLYISRLIKNTMHFTLLLYIPFSTKPHIATDPPACYIKCS